MERPRTPYRELVDIENNKILGTLTPDMWAIYQEAKAITEFYELPMVDEWMDGGIRMSSSVGGEHRRDLKEAVQGQRQPTVALGVPFSGGELNGHDKGAKARDIVRPRL